MSSRVDIDEVRSYWNENPLSASAIPHPLYSPEYYAYYDRLRELNESVAVSNELHEYESFAGRKVLDVGCGNGYVVSRYAAAGAIASGVDVTETAVQLTQRRLELMGLEADIRVASAEDLPFEDATFDCVSSMGVVHHTPDTPRAISEIHRVLKPGGRLILMVYHRNSLLYRVNFPLQRLMTGKSMQQLVDEVDGIGNPKGDVYSRAELRRLLGSFTEVEMFAGLLQPWMVAPRLGRLVPAAALRPLAGRLGWFLYAKARKDA